jgi:hypothetical protein
MARKLTDAEVGELRLLVSQASSAAEEAEAFGVTAQYARRLGSGRARPQLGGLDERLVTGSVAAAVERLLAGLRTSPESAVRAETARLLAEKLYACRASDAVAAAQVAPRLAESLVGLVLDLRERVAEPDTIDLLRIRAEAKKLAAMMVREEGEPA